MDKITRRRFLSRAALGCAIGAGGLALAGVIREIIPPLTRTNKKFTIGNLYDYPVNTFTLLPKHKVFILRDHEGVRAMSAVCTHLGCTLKRAEDGFLCPCHGSKFDQKGKVLSGPAPSSLAFFRVDSAPGGQLRVNMDQHVSYEEKFEMS